jgi:hypothetical protein
MSPSVNKNQNVEYEVEHELNLFHPSFNPEGIIPLYTEKAVTSDKHYLCGKIGIYILCPDIRDFIKKRYSAVINESDNGMIVLKVPAAAHILTCENEIKALFWHECHNTKLDAAKMAVEFGSNANTHTKTIKLILPNGMTVNNDEFNYKRNKKIKGHLEAKLRWTNVESEVFAPYPVPTIKMIPDWYKKQTSSGSDEDTLSRGFTSSTIKRCMPFFDLMTSGYMLLMPCDIYIDASNPEQLKHTAPEAIKDVTENLFSSHNREQYAELPYDRQYYHKDL